MIGVGQIWSKCAGVGSFGRDFQQTNDSGYIILGASNNDAVLIRTNQNGDTLWSREYNNFSPQRVLEVMDGGYIISGSVFIPIGAAQYSYIGLIKTDANGQLIWQKNYNRGGAGSIIETADSGYIFIAGESINSSPQNTYNTLLIKTDSYGDTVWTSILTSHNNGWIVRCYEMRKTFDQGYIIAGSITPPHSIFTGHIESSYFIKTDSLGNKEWDRSYLALNYDYSKASSIQQTNDSGYIFCGYAGINFFDPINNHHIYEEEYNLYGKLDNQGFLVWEKQADIISSSHGLTKRGRFFSIEKTFDGNYIMSSDPLSLSCIVEIDFAGNILCQRQISYALTIVKQANDSAYVCLGTGAQGLCLVKLYCNSSTTSIINVLGKARNKELIKVTDMLGRETKGKKNEPLFYIFDDGTVEKRIIIE